MARVSSRLIGKEIGRSGQEVDLLLEEIGFLSRKGSQRIPEDAKWEITELGRQHGKPSRYPFSSGCVWDPEVAVLL